MTLKEFLEELPKLTEREYKKVVKLSKAVAENYKKHASQLGVHDQRAIQQYSDGFKAVLTALARMKELLEGPKEPPKPPPPPPPAKPLPQPKLKLMYCKKCQCEVEQHAWVAHLQAHAFDKG